MPNWCSNVVNFLGEVPDLNELRKDFLKVYDDVLSKNGQGENLGHLLGISIPEESNANGEYVFYCSPLGDDENASGVDESVVVPSFSISFDTKHSPKPHSIVLIAQKYNLEFRLYYDELGNGVYGAYVYQNGSLHNIEFSIDEIRRFYDEDGDFDHDSANDLLESKIEDYLEGVNS